MCQIGKPCSSKIIVSDLKKKKIFRDRKTCQIILQQLKKAKSKYKYRFKDKFELKLQAITSLDATLV